MTKKSASCSHFDSALARYAERERGFASSCQAGKSGFSEEVQIYAVGGRGALTAVNFSRFGIIIRPVPAALQRSGQRRYPMTSLARHPEANIVRLQLRQNRVLRHMTRDELEQLEPLLDVADYAKGALLENQGDSSMQQYFILDGILKRVVSNAAGKEMILRFAAETEIDTSYAAWRLKTTIPYSIRAVTRVRTAQLSMEEWAAFVERHPLIKSQFEFEVMKLMSEVMAHTITLHLLDAPGRVARFMRKHAALIERVPKKELASYLNLSPETLSRLKRRGKIDLL